MLIGGSEVRGPRYTEQEARPEVPGPRSACQEPSYAFHGPCSPYLATRTSVLGPAALRCADTAGQFGVDGDDLYADNKPERKSSQQNLATKLDRCLPTARPPKKGGWGSGWCRFHRDGKAPVTPKAGVRLFGVVVNSRVYG